MSLMVDPSLNWIFYIIAGDAWPQGDEDALRELAAEWDDVAQRIASAGQGFNQLSQHVTANVGGDVQTNFIGFANNLSTMGSTFVARAQQQAASLREQALNIENAKYGMLISIAVTAAEVLWALADPFTAPLVPEIMAVGREVVNEVERTLIQRLTSLLSRIAREAAEEAIEEVAEDMLAQGIQIAQGNRNGFDWNSIKQSAILGGAGGAFAHGAGKGLGKFDNKFGTNFSKNVFGESGIEAATEVVVGGLGAVAFGGDLDSLGWSALNGGLSGAATHGAHHAGESLADSMKNGGDSGGKGGGPNDVGDTGFNKGNVGDIKAPPPPAGGGDHGPSTTDTGGSGGTSGPASGVLVLLGLPARVLLATARRVRALPATAARARVLPVTARRARVLPETARRARALATPLATTLRTPAPTRPALPPAPARTPPTPRTAAAQTPTRPTTARTTAPQPPVARTPAPLAARTAMARTLAA